MNIEIEIPVSELKTALPGLAKIVPRSSALPVLQCVKVSQVDSAVLLQAHNLDEVATVRIPNRSSGAPGELLVPLDTLTKIAKGCSGEQSIRLIGTENETKIRYSVAGSYLDRVLAHIPPHEWPEVKVINQEPVVLDDSFKVALREALECASADSSRFVLNGACLDVRDKDAHYVVGTDGRHLYSANTFHFGLPESIILPSRKFISWAGLFSDGQWKLGMSPGIKSGSEGKAQQKEEPPWFQIETDRWTYLAKAVDGQFPNWKQVIPGNTSGWTRIDLQPSAVGMMLETVPLLPGNEDADKPIRLLAGNGLVLRAKARDQFELTSVMVPDVSVVGKCVEVSLNRNYLSKALRFGFTHIHVENSLSPLVFSATGKSMVVMPLRMPDPDTVPAAEASVAQPQTAESVSAMPPSAAEPQTTTEERKDMSTTMTAPERGNLRAGNNGQGESKETRQAFKAALERLDTIRTNLRDVIGDLSEVGSLLKIAEREQRASAREIEGVRAKLREIRSVEI